MGSGGSKARGSHDASTPSQSPNVSPCMSGSTGGGGVESKGKEKCKGNSSCGIFQSSCFRSSSSPHNVHGANEESGGSDDRTVMESELVGTESCRKVKEEECNEIPCVCSTDKFEEWGRVHRADGCFGTGTSSSRAASTQSVNSPGQFFSRCRFIPGNASFRLSRAASLGSSTMYPVPSSRLSMFDNDDDESTNTCQRSGNGLHFDDDSSADFLCHAEASDIQGVPSLRNATRNEGIPAGEVEGNFHCQRDDSDLDGIQSRLYRRRVGGREPVEGNARFSRTLSVGRLRDRVVRRSMPTDLTFCPLQQEREVRDAGEGSESRGLVGEPVPSELEHSAPLQTPLSDFSGQDHEGPTSGSREGRYHEVPDYRSNFLENRRRIQTQVVALERLGSRFTNLARTSCILSGLHRTDQCTCAMTSRGVINSNTRASISRIVMLTEALFEVMDEIHQQSVVQSSQSLISSLGSVPAPAEVVESFPVKSYLKSQKQLTEDTSQCYICLVEYEDGDSVRILPCHHEFHSLCIDKWLKEIHRVCPLCRRNICTYGPILAETQGC